jgi:hypothetical protein
MTASLTRSVRLTIVKCVIHVCVRVLRPERTKRADLTDRPTKPERAGASFRAKQMVALVRYRLDVRAGGDGNQVIPVTPITSDAKGFVSFQSRLQRRVKVGFSISGAGMVPASLQRRAHEFTQSERGSRYHRGWSSPCIC